MAIAARIGWRHGLLGLLLLAGPGFAEETPSPPAGLACPPRAPRLQLTLVDPPAALDAALGVERLQALAGQGRARPGGAQHLGLTTSRVEWRSALTARFSRAPLVGGAGRASVAGPASRAEAVCAVPDGVTLRLVQAEHTIRVAAEIPRPGCLYRAVLAHERRHAAVNRASLRVAADAARAAATDWAATAEARGATLDEALGGLQAGLRRAIEPALAALREARTAAHEAIDTPAEYRRLGALCPADQARLRERLREPALD